MCLEVVLGKLTLTVWIGRQCSRLSHPVKKIAAWRWRLMNTAILTNLFKLWMGKKHDRQGPLAYMFFFPSRL